jgi:hypothetical protein
MEKNNIGRFTEKTTNIKNSKGMDGKRLNSDSKNDLFCLNAPKLVKFEW